jgi:L-methionine (R)-S-oxide reductase
MPENVFGTILSAVSEFADRTEDLTALQQFIVELISSRLPYYNWTGFYMLDPHDANTLVLGAFHGAPTTHVRIPVTEGICGAAVAQGETVIVEDVSSDPRYLACSIETKSEIVVPIYVKGKIVGEIDIDSHELNTFGDKDRAFLEECTELVGRFIERAQKVAVDSK